MPSSRLSLMVGIAAGLVTAAASTVLVVAAHVSPVWVVLGCLALVAVVCVMWSGDPVRALLYLFIFTAPIAITKSLVSRHGLYPPSLELWLSDLPLSALFAVCAVRMTVNGERPRAIGPWSWWFGSLCAWTALSATMAEQQMAGALAFVTQLKFVMQFLVIRALVTDVRTLRRVLLAAAAGLALNLLVVGVQVSTGSPLVIQGAKASSGAQIYAAIEGLRTFRPSGLLLHPNPFASYLVMTVPVAIALGLVGRPHVPAAVMRVSLTLAAGGCLALLLTLSRGGWVSFAVALCVLIVGLARARLLGLRRIVTVGSLGATAVACILLVYPTIVYRLTRGDQRSTESRWMLMQQAALVIRAHPILGVGPGNYENAAQRFSPASFASLPPEYRASFRRWIVHNGYLLIWAERGLIGLLLHLAVVLTALNQLRKVSAHDPTLRAVAIGLTAAVAGQLTFYQFDHFYQDLYPGTLWILLGLSAALTQVPSSTARVHIAAVGGGRIRRLASPATRHGLPA